MSIGYWFRLQPAARVAVVLQPGWPAIIAWGVDYNQKIGIRIYWSGNNTEASGYN